MLFILSEIMDTKILSDMRESDHFAFMFDDTTDCSVIKQPAIHGHYIDKETGACYLKVMDILQPEIDALQDDSTPTEMDARISVCASTITRRI